MKTGLLFKIAFFVFCLPFYGVGQVTYTVNTTDDLDDGVCDGVHCSLREAVDTARYDGDYSIILFNLSGATPHQIDLSSFLVINDSITIDAGQSGFSLGELVISSTSGLYFYQKKVVLKKLKILSSDMRLKGLSIIDSCEFIGQDFSLTDSKGTILTNTIFRECYFDIHSDLNMENNFFQNSWIDTRGTTGAGNITIKNNDFIAEGAGLHGYNALSLKGSNNQITENDFEGFYRGIITNGTVGDFSKNTFSCNIDAILSNSNNTAKPVISSLTNQDISGTAEPLAIIELFSFEQNCTQECQGQNYLGFTNADATGNWSFSFTNPLSQGISVAVTGLVSNKSISDFSLCQLVAQNNSIYIVNTTDDLDDGVCNTSHCSLREAINAANTDFTSSEIQFDFSSSPPHIITTSSLPEVQNYSLEINIGNSNMELGDLTIENGTAWGFSDLILKNVIFKNSSEIEVGEHSFIDSCYFYNTTINANLADSSIISNSLFTDYGVNNSYAISTYRGPLTILNNTINANHNGIKTTGWGGGGNLMIKGNNIYTNQGTHTGRGIVIKQANNEIIENKIIGFHTGINIQLRDNNLISKNLLECNNIGIDLVLANQSISPPSIANVNTSYISGTSLANSTIEIFQMADTTCLVGCQGNIYIGTTTSDNNGGWVFPTPMNLKLNDKLTATVTDSNNNTSEYSTCYIILPDDCRYAQPLPVNNQACSSVGVVLDLKELTVSTPTPTSSCAATFVGNDAWYKIIVPSTGNFLVRTNTNNTVVPVIELYTACGNTSLSKCGILDTLPYLMTFENYIPGDSLLLRVWDKDNAIVNSPGSALLHLTAHKLDSLKENWLVCDYENLISNNPTNLSRREASNFILSYEPNTPQSIIDADSIAFTDMMEMEKKKSCSCGIEELQLWGTDTPVTLDGRKRYAKSRGSVDTTNYNYIFETVEFQVNSYAIGQQHSTDIAMDAEGNFVMVWKDEQREHNYGRVYLSSGNPVSVEFPIGSSSKTQYDTKVEMLDNGEFITVWHEIDPTQAGATFAVYGLLFYANGEPKSPVFEISLPSANTSPNQNIREYAQFGTNAQVAAISDGSFIVVWQVGGNVFAQRFDAAASLVGSIIEVGNTVSLGINPNPAISISDSGAFIITWTGIDGDGNGIYAQRFSADGTPLADAFLVNTTESKNQSNPDITIFDDDSFVIAWESLEQFNSTSDYDVYAQRFNASASKIGGEFLINTYTDDAQSRPSIARFDNGNFLIAWSSFGQDGYEEGIYAKLFDVNGISIAPSFDDADRGSEGHEFRMNAYHDPQQDKPRTATNGENIFMGAWEDGANDGSFEGIFAQRYETVIANNTQVFKPIGTATPSSLLGDQKAYASTPYNPGTSVKKAKVAIIDTGVKNLHSLLTAAIWNNPEVNDTDNCLVGDDIGYDFVNRSGILDDIDGHGTQVNGILADSFNTEVKLELMNLKFHELNNGSVFDAICAIYYAVDNGADVINLSWGFEASEEPVILKKALQYASDNDVLIVTTAGNTSKDNDEINKYPANLDIPNMIVVTSFHYKAETDEYKLSNYASYGKTNVDIAAYGYVETASVDGGKTDAAGTSMAAPAVARTAATIKGLYPILTAAEIKDCILSSAETKANFNNLVATGGILNHDAALACAEAKAATIIDNACPTSGLTISADSTGACNTNLGAIDLSFTGNDPNPTFLWSTGDTSQNISNLIAGDYSVTVTDTARCEQTLDITVTNDCVSCQSNLVLNDANMAGDTYQSDNTIISSGTIEFDTTVVFKAAESITLLAGFHAKGGSDFLASIEACTNTLTEEVAESRTTIPIEEDLDLRAKVYPNPTQDLLTVEVLQPIDQFHLELYDVMGRRLNHWKVGGNKKEIDVLDLSAGIYFIRIDNELIKKFVVGKK